MKEVFCKIDEKPFSVVYSNVGCSNFPVNIVFSLEFSNMKDFSHNKLIEAFYFNYLINYAVGIGVLGEVNLAEKTLDNFRNRIFRYLIEHPEK